MNYISLQRMAMDECDVMGKPDIICKNLRSKMRQRNDSFVRFSWEGISNIIDNQSRFSEREKHEENVISQCHGPPCYHGMRQNLTQAINI